jgi:hypothetical protein
MTDYLKEHLKILKLAVEDKLPDTINKDSGLALHAVEELIDLGLLKATNARSLRDKSFLNPSITMAGRIYLEKREEERKERTFARKVTKFFPKVFGWIFGIIAAIICALAIAWLGKHILGK